MKTRFRIGSYFSLATDLAAAMRDWPEFVDGSGYDVNLRSVEEEVSVRYHEDEEPYVIIASSHVGPLFERVTGRVALCGPVRLYLDSSVISVVKNRCAA